MFRVISKDRLVAVALDTMKRAAEGWLNGPPQEEIALLSRITEGLLHPRKRCDIGMHSRVSFKPKVEVWHRKGPGTSDLYGCDLAVTLDIPDEPFQKTACFQLKRSDSGSVQLEPSQLAVAQKSPYEAQTFVLAADKNHGEYRLQGASSVSAGRQSTSHWLPLADWLVQWLDCKIGTPRNQQATFLSTSLAALFRPEVLVGDVPAFPSPEGFEPLRVWLLLRLTSKQ